MSLISVIVPVYKVEEYLCSCIDSILAQTYQDFELILVDDGSPDNCGVICDEYAAKDMRIRVIHQENGGLSAARNAGLDVMRGEYVTFVDSDDIVYPTMFERLTNAIRQSDADIAVGGYGRNNHELCASRPQSDDIIKTLTGREACQLLLDPPNTIKFVTAWGKLYKASLFSNTRYPVGRIHEDEATTYKLYYQAKKVAVIDAALYYYRVNENGIMNTGFSAQKYDAIWAFQKRADFYRQHGDEELCQKTSAHIPVAIAMLYVNAKEAGVEEEVPMEYRMSEWTALRIIRQNCPDEKYTYYLSKVHPNWLLPHAYLRKLKKILHIPCK